MDRRLAATLAADVVGYSRLMGADEVGTLTRLKALRRELVQPRITERRGRVVKLMGDGLLAEFPSVVEAVQCASDIQQAMAEREPEIPDDRRIRLRTGINLGDIIFEGSDIYGDGVNVAARLEGLADPGGICISGAAFDAVDGKLDLTFENVGEQQVKNIAKPVRIYRLASASSQAGSPIRPKEPLPLPDKPSIAVLPFDNMSGDPEQEFFSDGITEDIITALSKIGNLLVVARNSTFTYKGHAVDVKQVSREQGVRYVLEGSVRKASKRVRVTTQLIDAMTGHHLWAERYDRDLDDIFAVQDEITREVVVALDVRLRAGEQARFWSSSTKSLEAWESVRLGMDLLNCGTLEALLDAKPLCQKALELDPNYAMAWVMLGWTHHQEIDAAVGYTYEGNRESPLKAAMDCAERALKLDPECADAYSLLSVCCLSNGQYDQAIAMTEKAVALAPNHADILATCAITHNKSGQPHRALELIRKAMRLCPIYSGWFLWVLGSAYRLLGQTDNAVEAFEAAIERNNDFISIHISLASMLGQLGRLKDAKAPISNILRLRPDFSIKSYMAELSYRDPAEMARFEDGLRKVGLPR